MPPRIVLSIESHLDRVALIGAALRAVCGLSRLTPEQVDELELSVVEAINNVIRHGYGGRPGMPVAVEITLHDDRLAVDIRDRGAAIPSGLLEGALAETGFDCDPNGIDALPESGMGLKLIAQLATGIRYASTPGGENELHLEKLLPTGDAGA